MLKLERRTEWKCPETNDARVLTMPNLPRPCHGPGLQPRTIYGRVAWDKTRKRCYVKAGFKCEACGADVSASGKPQAHELFNIDYEAGTSTFVRCVCLCSLCHQLTIHNGRALTLFKQGNPLYRAEVLLKAAESSFKAVHDWNVAHPGETPLKMYATFTEYLKEPELAAGMQDLIAKYHIKFWVEDKKKFADWGKWKVIVDGKDYPTPYASYDDWVTAMQKESLNDPERQVSNPFSGGVYDEVKEFLKGENK